MSTWMFCFLRIKNFYPLREWLEENSSVLTHSWDLYYIKISFPVQRFTKLFFLKKWINRNRRINYCVAFFITGNNRRNNFWDLCRAKFSNLAIFSKSKLYHASFPLFCLLAISNLSEWSAERFPFPFGAIWILIRQIYSGSTILRFFDRRLRWRALRRSTR